MFDASTKIRCLKRAQNMVFAFEISGSQRVKKQNKQIVRDKILPMYATASQTMAYPACFMYVLVDVLIKIYFLVHLIAC